MILVMVSIGQHISILFSPAVNSLCLEVHSPMRSNFRIQVPARSIQIQVHALINKQEYFWRHA